MLTRRNFLQQSSLFSLSPVVPMFIAQTAASARPQSDDRLLVVIELNGGNDGLNTVIPFADENYAKYRQRLRVEKDIIKLNDSLGLHPSMKAAGELYDSQRLAIVPGVGYPNPNRSHFRSMAIWHSARLEAVEHTGQGWLGRVADSQKKPSEMAPDAIFAGAGTTPAAIMGRRSNSISLNSEQELLLADGVTLSSSRSAADNLNAFVQRTVDSSFEAAQRFAASTSESGGDRGYPNYSLAQKLRLIARIIRMGGDTRLFYTSQSGYDTHSAQKATHERLLREFARSLKAFLEDLEQSGLANRVLVLAFSEFGRRVQENASAGTDHGAAGPVFVAGKSVRSGILGAYPSLTDLDDGDLRMTVDFRSVYASVLADWLGVDPAPSLGGTFDALKIVS